MINTKCENFHSGETLSKTLCNKTAGTLVPIHAELQKKKKKKGFQFSQNFDWLLLWTENLNYLFQSFSSSSVSVSDEILHTTAPSV